MNAAALFDLDGVLIDTRGATLLAMHRLASEALGVAVPVERVEPHIWRSPIDVLRELGVTDPVSVCRTGFDQALKNELGSLRVFTDAVDGLVKLAGRGIKIGVVTAQARRRLPMLLPAAVAAAADVVVSADDVTRGKPDPEGILLALTALDAPAHRAVFVGDTVTDIAAAAAAGVRGVGAAWGYVGEDPLRAAGAHVVLTDPAQLTIAVFHQLQFPAPAGGQSR